MSSPLVGPPIAKAKAMYCPNCGGPVEFRGFGRAMTVVCPQCKSLLDASSPLLKLVQQAQEAQSQRTPQIPLGTRGTFEGAKWECIGFQSRGVEDDGTFYEWEEYLLFNPYKGFRYLTCYQGHWNYVTPVECLPERRTQGMRPAVFFEGELYRHFSGANAQTVFVLGEFPWRVKVGDTVIADDFVHPPNVLSSETTDDEITWSKGVYTAPADVWKAFNLPGSPPKPQGVYLNQPSPHPGSGGIWAMFLLMELLLIIFAIAFGVLSRNQKVFEGHYKYSSADRGEPSFVTQPFDITGRTANAELTINTNLTNDWAYFNLALINEQTGDAFDFGREVSYYTGYDSDGSWSEGSQSNSATIPHVAPGRYYLRIEPEMEGSDQPKPAAGTKTRPLVSHTVYYGIILKHDVPGFGWFVLAGFLLLLPPIFSTIRGAAFETRRWAASDYPPTGGG